MRRTFGNMNSQITSACRLRDALRETLNAAELDCPGQSLIVAISGGADSVALLHALAAEAPRMHLHLVAAHLDHGIRPESGQDAEFVKTLCDRLQIPLETEIVDVPAAARLSDRSIEMQARVMRYDFFNRAALRHQAHAVLTAHTRDDQAETLLLNLCRGASPSAMGGIPPDTRVNNVRVLRPFLSVNRSEIETYLRSVGQVWKEDATNQDTAYRRNAVRHRVLPLLKEALNPRVSDALARAAGLLRNDNDLLDELACEAYGRVFSCVEHPDALMLAPFRACHPALRFRILARWFKAAGVPAQRLRHEWIDRVDELARQPGGGGTVRLCHGLEIRHAYDRLTVGGRTEEFTPPSSISRMTFPGTTELTEFDCAVSIQFATGFEIEPAGIPGQLPSQVHLRRPAQGESFVFTVRHRNPGDRIQMQGMKGSKKIQDILIDSKVPANRRDRIPVFCINDQVAWLPGCRPSALFCVSAPNAPSLCIRFTSLSPTKPSGKPL